MRCFLILLDSPLARVSTHLPAAKYLLRTDVSAGAALEAAALVPAAALGLAGEARGDGGGGGGGAAYGSTA